MNIIDLLIPTSAAVASLVVQVVLVGDGRRQVYQLVGRVDLVLLHHLGVRLVLHVVVPAEVLGQVGVLGPIYPTAYVPGNLYQVFLHRYLRRGLDAQFVHKFGRHRFYSVLP